MKTTATAPAPTSLSALSDDELALVVGRTWGVNRTSDQTLLDHLARRLGVRLPLTAVLQYAALLEIDARAIAREGDSP